MVIRILRVIALFTPLLAAAGPAAGAREETAPAEAGPAAAREADEAREPESGPPPPRLSWALSGEARFRPEWRDDADLEADEDDDLRQGLMRLRVGVSLGVGEDYRLFFQAQDARVAGEEASTASNERNLDLHQGYLEMTPTLGRRLELTLGRQEWKYGDERLIGAFGWSNIGRSFDGVRARWRRPAMWVDALVAGVTSRTVAGATRGSDLYGLYAQAAPRPAAEYEGYWLAFTDSERAAGETGVLDDTAIHAVGARVKDRLGWFDFTAEAVIERGRFRGDELAAAAAAAQAGAGWGQSWKWRAFAGYDVATGDEDPADGRREEFFNFFPTNHPLYGYADYEGWRNLRSPYAGVSLSRARHYAQVKAHRFLLEEERGPWKDAGGTVLGFDPAGASGAHVGGEVDLTYRLAWRERSSLEVGLSRFAPGRFARLTRDGDPASGLSRDPSHWAYVMLTVGF